MSLSTIIISIFLLLQNCTRFFLPDKASVLSFPENSMGTEAGMAMGTGILKVFSSNLSRAGSVFGKDGLISGLVDRGKMAPVCLAK